jgi:hypothetical protein
MCQPLGVCALACDFAHGSGAADVVLQLRAVLCCAVLCCAVLCCAVLCCAVLCCAVLCCVLCLAAQVVEKQSVKALLQNSDNELYYVDELRPLGEGQPAWQYSLP